MRRQDKADLAIESGKASGTISVLTKEGTYVDLTYKDGLLVEMSKPDNGVDPEIGILAKKVRAMFPNGPQETAMLVAIKDGGLEAISLKPEQRIALTEELMKNPDKIKVGDKTVPLSLMPAST